LPGTITEVVNILPVTVTDVVNRCWVLSQKLQIFAGYIHKFQIVAGYHHKL